MKRKKKKKRAAAAKRSKGPNWLLIGGGLLGAALLVTGIAVAAIVFGLRGGIGGIGGGSYTVIDQMADPPPASAEYQPDSEIPPFRPRPVWGGAVDPPEKPIDYANAVGAPTTEPSVLVASQGGPYVIGVPINASKRTKLMKGNGGAQTAKQLPADAPFPVVDILTGKEVGSFPVACALHTSHRLSPDGQYLIAGDYEADPAKPGAGRQLAVWKRGQEKPMFRWLLPAHTPWVEFTAPDRLALYTVGAKPQFTVLDITKGAEVFSIPLPTAEFPPGIDNTTPFYRVRYPCGAVSPGGKLVAIAGQKSDMLVYSTADGKMLGRLPLGPVLPQDFRAIAFDETGSELRAVYRSGPVTFIRCWSMGDGQERYLSAFNAEGPFGNTVLTGPDPGTLIVGQTIVELQSGRPVGELPGPVFASAGKDKLLAFVHVREAVNAKEIQDSVDYIVGSGVFPIALKRDEYRQKAAALVKSRETLPGARPPTEAIDRSSVAVIRPNPAAPWAVKPSAAPPIPADAALQTWPELFGATEGASVPQGRGWIRYDLKTGKKIGEQIELWPVKVTDLKSTPGRLTALSLDGRRLAVVDPGDFLRVDIWENSGARLAGFRPYPDEAIAWIGWSANGELLTAATDRITGWDVTKRKALFEIQGAYKNWTLAPGCGWLLTSTPRGNLDFYDTTTGQYLGRLPPLGQTPGFSLSPDGKTLVRPVPTRGYGGFEIQVWDLQTGKQSAAPETPLGPVMGTWADGRHILSNTGGNAPRLLLYDLDVHTHTYSYELVKGVDVHTDTRGRGWMTLPGREGFGRMQFPGVEGFKQELALAPGSTIRVEIDVCHRDSSQKVAKLAAEQLQKRGLKVGRGGWVLRADHTIGHSSQQFDDQVTGKKRSSPYISLEVAWKLIAPDGTEVWQGKDGSIFDPFRSKYVVVGSRKGTFGPQGGGYRQVEIDFGDKNPQTAQIEEIVETTILMRQTLPASLPAVVAKTGAGYMPLPINEKIDGAK
ncbi:MAG TPA: WD40 repeat domain-containing protein [Gemmataceae bacterium]|nr:WD40 repeat domain-containing protein [Gemmataceae bacterium]